MRAILHSDMNSYYASVEMMLDPSLKGKAVAVCGSTETRHGIVLAKSELAKKFGVKTGMANWEAQRCCPNLITVPPHYEQYIKYSELAHEIYGRYTDLIEPFGMDECWLDVTGSSCIGDPLSIAESIRETMRSELGLTVSIGVSFNKVFAKLGSDMKKPDAITCITPESYKTQVWPLKASELLGVGPATTKKLAIRGVMTIGDLAKSDPMLLRSWLGVNGLKLWEFANGTDLSRVSPYGYDYSHDGYVFVDALGRRMKPDYISSTFSVLLEKKGLKRIRFHDLRHSCASLLLANGVPMKQIQEWLGHSDFNTTANIYAHLDYSSKVTSAQAMEKGLPLPAGFNTNGWNGVVSI